MKLARFTLLFIVSICLFACKDTKRTSGESTEVVQNNLEQPLASTAVVKSTEAEQAAKGADDMADSTLIETAIKDAPVQVDQFVKQQAIVTAGEIVEVKVKGEDKVVRGSKVTLKPTAVKRKSRKSKSKKSKAVITFEDPVLDFGEIKAGEIITHEFVFTNTGQKALQIKDAKPSCGCTYPSLPFLPIQPGEQGKIGIEYNSVGKNGPQNATVTINSNASEPSFELLLKGNVIGDDKEEVLYDLRDVVKKNSAIRDSIKKIKTDSTGGGE